MFKVGEWYTLDAIYRFIVLGIDENANVYWVRMSDEGEDCEPSQISFKLAHKNAQLSTELEKALV
jgi:hypothetical protein